VGAVQSAKEFLEKSGFHRKLERWIFEHDIGAALYDAGFDLVRMKKVPELGVMAVTGRSTISRQSTFTEGATTRIKKALRERGLTCNTDYVNMGRQDRTLTVVVGVELPTINESRRQRRRWRSGKLP
jgi:hypothetical protein